MIIAHRLSTILQCDRIFLLADGSVKEQGTHAELIALGGQYYELVKAQAGIEISMKDRTDKVPAVIDEEEIQYD